MQKAVAESQFLLTFWTASKGITVPLRSITFLKLNYLNASGKLVMSMPSVIGSQK